MTKTIEQRGKDKNDDQAHAWRGLSNRKKGETKGTGKGKKIDEKKEFLTGSRSGDFFDCDCFSFPVDSWVVSL